MPAMAKPTPARTSRFLLLCSLLAGCQTLGVVRDCGDYPFFWSASTNLVMLPFASSASDNEEPYGAAFERALQLELVGSLSRYRGTKVIRLSDTSADPEKCKPESVMRAWSGCSVGPSLPVLIPREPVVLLWANTIQLGDNSLIQFNLRMWRVDSDERIEILAAGPGYKSTIFVAGLPARQLAFPARQFARADLVRFQVTLKDSGLRLDPNPSSPAVVLGDSDSAGLFTVKSVKSINGEAWIEAQLTSGAIGWIRIPDSDSLKDRFPELAFVELVTAYFEYLRFPESKRIDDAKNAFDRYVREEQRLGGGGQRSILVAKEIFATMLLLDGIRHLNQNRLNETLKLVGAEGDFPRSAELANIYLLADFALQFGRSSSQALRNAGLRVEIAAGQARASWLEGAFVALARTIQFDPTNREALTNTATVARLLKDAGVRSVGGFETTDVELRLRSVLASSKAIRRADHLCESAD